MATLADLLASVNTGNMVAGNLPQQRTPFVSGRSKFLDTVGRVGDVLAAMGGRTGLYGPAVKAEEDAFNQAMQQQRQRNVFADFMSRPDDPMALQNLAMESPELAMQVAPQNKVVGDRVINFSPLGGTAREVVGSAPEAPQREPMPTGFAGLIALRDRYPEGSKERALIDAKIRKDTYIAPQSSGGGGAGGAGGRVSRPFGPEDYALYGIDPSVPMAYDRFGQAKPVGGVSTVAEGARGGLNATQFAQAKGRLARLPTLESQIGRLEDAAEKLEGSLAAGFLGGRLPEGLSSTADIFESTLGQVRASIRSLTRVAGEGSISDYETRLNNALLPARTQTAEGRREALANLRALTRDLRNEYQSMLSGGLAGGGRPASPSPRNAPTATGPNGQKIMWNGTSWVPAR